MQKTVRLIPAALFLAITMPAAAQDLGESIERVGMEYATAYVHPLVNAFGADVNGGLFHAAKFGGGMVPKVDLYVGVKIFGAFVPERDRALNLQYEAPARIQAPDGNAYDVTVRYDITDAPTIFGRNEAGTVTAHVHETVSPGADGTYGTADDIVIDEEETLELVPGLINTGIAPLLIPQLRLGTLYGTDVMIRYFPRMDHVEFGSLGFFGLGVRHEVSQYLPSAPVDLSVQLVRQKLSVRDLDDDQILAANMFAAALVASKSASVATLYGGLQLESTRVKVDYVFSPDDEELIEPQEISFSLTGRNRFRVVAGGALTIGPVVINADYSVGSINVVSAGIGLSL